MKRLLCTALTLLIALSAAAFAEASAANPWEETDAQDLKTRMYYVFAEPDGAKDIRYFVNESQLMGEQRFTMDGAQFTMRIAPAEDFTDISGLYCDWEEEKSFDLNGLGGVEYIAHDDGLTVDLCLWHEISTGLMYSLSAVGEDLTGVDLPAVALMEFLPDAAPASASSEKAEPAETPDAQPVKASGPELALPDGAKDVQTGSNPKTGAGKYFFYLDGHAVDMSYRPGFTVEQVNELFPTWEPEPCTVHGREGLIGRDEDDILGTMDACVWFDDVSGLTYILAVQNDDPEGFDVLALAEQMFVPAQDGE